MMCLNYNPSMGIADMELTKELHHIPCIQPMTSTVPRIATIPLVARHFLMSTIKMANNVFFTGEGHIRMEMVDQIRNVTSCLKVFLLIAMMLM